MKKWGIGIIFICVLLTACANSNNGKTTNNNEEISINAEDIARVNSMVLEKEDLVNAETGKTMEGSDIPETNSLGKPVRTPYITATPIVTEKTKTEVTPKAKDTPKPTPKSKEDQTKEKTITITSTPTGIPTPILTTIPTQAVANIPATTTQGTGFAGQEIINELLALMNAERANRGVGPLTIANNLSLVSQTRSIEIESCFSHVRPDGTLGYVLIENAGIAYTAYAENIASGYNTPQDVHNAWMASAQHAAAIVDATYTRVGIACHTGNDGKKYWVQTFLN